MPQLRTPTAPLLHALPRDQQPPPSKMLKDLACVETLFYKVPPLAQGQLFTTLVTH